MSVGGRVERAGEKETDARARENESDIECKRERECEREALTVRYICLQGSRRTCDLGGRRFD